MIEYLFTQYNLFEIMFDYLKEYDPDSLFNLNQTNRLLHSCLDKKLKNLRSKYDVYDKLSEIRTISTMFNNKLHSFNDLPSITEIDSNNKYDCFWHKHGQLHRDNDKPAHDGLYIQEWYQNGLRHRSCDKPAVIDGTLYIWYQYGKKYRGGGRPVAIRH